MDANMLQTSPSAPHGFKESPLGLICFGFGLVLLTMSGVACAIAPLQPQTQLQNPPQVQQGEAAPSEARQVEEPPIEDDAKEGEVSNHWNLPFPTMGGKQFWTDHQWRYGWRIQQNAMTGHWRLLDPNNMRHAWGNREACRAKLDQDVPLGKEEPPQRVVILMHGLMRTSGSMRSLSDRLASRGHTPIAVEYASTRASIADHAQALRSLVESLPGKPHVDFVAHSMGNIVIRRAIYDWQQPDGDPQQVLPRLGRMAMLGPPNQGATIAKRLSKTGVFGWVTGKGGMELGPEWASIEKTLATPPFPFIIVAGKLESSPIRNPLTEGDGDFVVSLEEAKLDGAEEFIEVPVLHSFLMDDEAVQSKVLSFLNREPR
jgi:pimeloyl-ACP methyl ester carboxylesterase